MKHGTAAIAKRRLQVVVNERRHGGRWVMVRDAGYVTVNVPLGPIARFLSARGRGRWRYLR